MIEPIRKEMDRGALTTIAEAGEFGGPSVGSLEAPFPARSGFPIWFGGTDNAHDCFAPIATLDVAQCPKPSFVSQRRA
jgi:hypothetical protein